MLHEADEVLQVADSDMIRIEADPLMHPGFIEISKDDEIFTAGSSVSRPTIVGETQLVCVVHAQ